MDNSCFIKYNNLRGDILQEESRKKIDRINELFNRLNLQIIQDKQISKLNKEGYMYIEEISEKLHCPEEILLMALSLFNEDTQVFRQPNGDSSILMKFATAQQWYENESQQADDADEDIINHLYHRYIGIDFSGCIPLCAAQDFTSQNNIPQKYLINAVRDNELHITKYNGEDMINEKELVVWIENKKGE